VDLSYRQIGALPYRLTPAGEREVLLVTSRGTRQWIIPKGWPMDDFTDPDAAAREAYEEAGLIGEIATKPVGTFTYMKQPKGAEAPAEIVVDVYPMRIDRQLAFWPEASQRQTAWMSPALAHTMVSNPTLRMLLATWSADPDS
jgi:8-oxo-dGTP pyrophosphatase MutT (NUDIX family)